MTAAEGYDGRLVEPDEVVFGHWTAGDFATMAGAHRLLTRTEVDRLKAAIPNSSIADALAEVASSIIEPTPDDDEDADTTVAFWRAAARDVAEQIEARALDVDLLGDRFIRSVTIGQAGADDLGTLSWNDDDEWVWTPAGPVSDAVVLDRIAHLLSAPEWPGSSGLEDIAEIVQLVRNIDDNPMVVWPRH